MNTFPGTDTVPNSPENIAEDYDNDFARLTPANDAARVAFHALAELMQLDDSRMPHARKFIHIESNRVQLSPDASTDSDTGGKANQPLLLHGHYRFNFDIPPKIVLIGWCLGRGGPYADNQADLHLFFTGGNGVHSRHARIVHDFKSNMLLVIAEQNRKLIVNGRHELNGSQRVLGDLKTSIEIGRLRYNFEYTVQGRSAYQQRLNEFKTSLGINCTVVPLSIDPTPSKHGYEFHHYFVQLAFEAGSTCTVLSGVHSITGTSVAVKRMNRSRQNAHRIAHEIQILQSIQSHQPHPNICRLVDEVVTGDRPEGPMDRRIDEAYLIYAPLASAPFRDLILNNTSFEDRLQFFKQLLQGLAYLHSIGVMHRDIKPDNLMVISYKPPRGMITDFGHATFDKTSKDHYKGTLCYLSPEAWDLKHGKEGAPAYDQRVDVWSYGVCSYELLCYKPRWWGGQEITPDISKGIDDDLGRVRTDRSTVASLIRRMLDRAPERRITAQEALEAAVVRDIPVPEVATASAVEQVGSKRKRV